MTAAPGSTFPPLRLAFPSRADWIFSRVLEHWAGKAPDRPFLQFMDTPPSPTERSTGG